MIMSLIVVYKINYAGNDIILVQNCDSRSGAVIYAEPHPGI